MKKRIFLLLIICLLSILLVSCGNRKNYKKALELIDAGDHAAAYEILNELGDYKDAKELLGNFRYVLLAMDTNYTAANGEPIESVDSAMTYTSDGLLSIWTRGTETYEYTYDENKKLIKEIRSTGDETWVANEYAYDEKGNLIKETNYAGQRPLWSWEYAYDDRGNMIQKVELYNYIGDLPYLEVRYTYDCTYDENDRLISSVTTWKGGSKELVDYVYDEGGRLIRKEQPTDGGAVTIAEYTYDERGNLLKEANDYYVIESTYDDNGNLVKQQQYAANNISGIRYIYEYTYDESGRLIKEECVHYSNGETKITINFTYDESGHLVKKHKEQKQGSKIGKVTYLYDTNGNLIEHIDEMSNGEVYTSKMTYKLVYIPYELHGRIESLIHPTYQ